MGKYKSTTFLECLMADEIKSSTNLQDLWDELYFQPLMEDIDQIEEKKVEEEVPATEPVVELPDLKLVPDKRGEVPPVDTTKISLLALLGKVPEHVSKIISKAKELEDTVQDFDKKGLRIIYTGERPMKMKKDRPQIFKNIMVTSIIGLKYERTDGGEPEKMAGEQRYMDFGYLIFNPKNGNIYVRMYPDKSPSAIRTVKYYVKEGKMMKEVTRAEAIEDCYASEFQPERTDVKPNSDPYQYNARYIIDAKVLNSPA